MIAYSNVSVCICIVNTIVQILQFIICHIILLFFLGYAGLLPILPYTFIENWKPEEKAKQRKPDEPQFL